MAIATFCVAKKQFCHWKIRYVLLKCVSTCNWLQSQLQPGNAIFSEGDLCCIYILLDLPWDDDAVCVPGYLPSTAWWAVQGLLFFSPFLCLNINLVAWSRTIGFYFVTWRQSCLTEQCAWNLNPLARPWLCDRAYIWHAKGPMLNSPQFKAQ